MILKPHWITFCSAGNNLATAKEILSLGLCCTSYTTYIRRFQDAASSATSLNGPGRTRHLFKNKTCRAVNTTDRVEYTSVTASPKVGPYICLVSIFNNMKEILRNFLHSVRHIIKDFRAASESTHRTGKHN
jgi:hypothetical protein